MNPIKKECFSLIQELTLLRYPYCVCGKPATEGHHLFGRGLSSAFEPEMVISVCRYCHNYFQRKSKSAIFYLRLLIPNYDDLHAKSKQPIYYMDYKKKRDELKDLIRREHGQTKTTIGKD